MSLPPPRPACRPRGCPPYLLVVILPLRLRQHGQDAVQTAVDQVRLHVLFQRWLQGADGESRARGRCTTTPCPEGTCTDGSPPGSPHTQRKGYAR